MLKLDVVSVVYICSLDSADSDDSTLEELGCFGDVMGELGESICVIECDLDDGSAGEEGGNVATEVFDTFMLPTTLLQRNWHALGVLSFK